MIRSLSVDFRSIFFLVLGVLTFTLVQAPLNGQGTEPVDSQLPEGFGMSSLQTIENLSSGVINLNLPIDNSIAPISLSYVTSGVRVTERAGLVGLGWNLEAGGYILRQKRGQADGKEHGYSGDNQRGQHVSTIPPEHAFHKMVGNKSASEVWDAEPDIYSFNFMGQSGIFTINSSRQVVMLSGSNLKIEPTFVAQSGAVPAGYSGYTQFKITDESGNQYLFDVDEKVKVFYDGTEIDEYRRKWHLSKVTYYQTNKELKFSYATAPIRDEITPFRERHVIVASGVVKPPIDKETKIRYTPKVIKFITLEDLKVEFVHGSRTDITGYKVDAIKFYGWDQLSHQYDFQYKYLGNGSSRLMLAGVRKSNLNVSQYQFSYYGELSNEPALPDYNSFKQDHWGYHNNNTASSLYPALGANRAPTLTYATANSLKKVYHSTGAYDEYFYQLNQYNDGGVTKNAGGLRIWQLRSKDGEGTSYTKTYDYSSPGSSISSGELYKAPASVYAHRYHDEFLHAELSIQREYSIEKLKDDLGRHIAYEYVTVTDVDGGKQQFKYKTFADDVVHFGTGSGPLRLLKGWNRREEEFEGTQFITLNNHDGPFGHNDFKGTSVGMLEEKLTMDSNGNPVVKEVYDYTVRTFGSNVFGMNALRQAYRKYNSGVFNENINRIDEYLVGVYALKHGYLVNHKKTTYNYDRGNSSNYITLITDNTYHPTKLLMTKSVTYLSSDPDNKRGIETDYYFESGGIPTEVNDNNLVTLVKESRTLVGTNTVAKTTTDYIVDQTKVYPANVKSYVNGNNLVKDEGFTHYLGEGASTSDNFTGYKSAILYDVYGRITARVANANQITAAFTSFERGEGGGWELNPLVHLDECGTVSNCQLECGGDDTCEDYCEAANDDVIDCQNSANLTDGYLDLFGYQLSEGNITKQLSAGAYYLSYWYKSGSVNIGGVSTNVLQKSATDQGWTFQVRRIVLGGTGNVTISGSADIDHLRIVPEYASITSNVYHPFFGKLYELDNHHNAVYYEYDAAGRQTLVKDDDKDVITSREYHVAQYLEASSSSLSVPYGGSQEKVYITSNTSWTVSDNKSWISVSPTTGDGMGELLITAANNPNTSSRSGTVTITRQDGQQETITVTQAANPGTISVSTSTVYMPDCTERSFTITSDFSWTATVVTPGSPYSISKYSGFGASTTISGTAGVTTVYITCNGNPPTIYDILVEVTGGSITRDVMISQIGIQ